MTAALAIGVARGRIELKQFFRNRSAAVFLFLFPIIMGIWVWVARFLLDDRLRAFLPWRK